MRLLAALSILLMASLARAQTGSLARAWQEVGALIDVATSNKSAKVTDPFAAPGQPAAEECDPFVTAVQPALDQGLARTAIARLRELETRAVGQQEWAYALKAVAEQMRLEVSLRGGNAAEVIPELQEKLRASPEPMKPLLNLLLAHHYWLYYNANRWDLQQRTRVEEGAEGGDVGTWSLPRLLAEIEKQFLRALAYEPVLKLIPVADFGAVLEKGTAPDAYRPTLYDFIAHELLDFYALGEVSGLAWNDDVSLSADGPALDDLAGFSFIIPDEAARRSPVLRALRLYQNLLRFHEGDADPAAYADADLCRLQFCYNQVTGESRDQRYAAALDRFAHRWKTHEVSSRAFALRARLALGQGDPGLARMIARNGAAGFPKSIGAAQCRNLVAEVEAPSLDFAAERVWCKPWPEMEITYKNLREVRFRAIPVRFEEFVASGFPLFAGTEQELVRRKPAKSWAVSLPAASDYKARTHRVPVPDSLPPGLYAVFASSDGSFEEKGKPVAMGWFRVSDLTLVWERRGSRLAGYVLTAREGLPVEGARVQVWRFDRKDAFRREQVLLTDADGGFCLSGDQSGQYFFEAEKNGQVAQTWEQVWKSNERERFDQPETHILFFTDRRIYRPGQTVQYKGVSFVTDRQNGRYYTVSGKAFTVQLFDCNDQPVAEEKVTGNDFGSFSGSFTLPRDRGTGEMKIKSGVLGEAWFSVEEYKRPKYEVRLDAPEGDARLGMLVSLSGTAQAFSGVPVAGAKVAWRVERSFACPFVNGYDAYGTVDAELAKGVTVTDGDGRFTVSFFAKPDACVPEKEEPAYTFLVTADATDSTGESRVGEQAVVLGYAAWRAQIDFDAWQTVQKPVEVSVALNTFAGGGVAAQGEMKMFAVKQPERVPRPRLSSHAHASGDAEREDDPGRWPEGQEVWSGPVQTDTNGAAAVSVPLKAGLYRVRFEARDPAGKAVTARQTLRVIDPEAKRLNIREPAYFEAESWEVEPGGTFRAVWGSGYESARALVLVEQNGLELLRVRTRPGVTQQQIELPVTEAMRGGVRLRTLFVRDNRLYAEDRTVAVPWSNKRLNLKWEHVTSRLEPGKKETWRAAVSDATGDPAEAEMVATLYDRSLDAFLPFGGAWNRSFDGFFKQAWGGASYELENDWVDLTQVFGSWGGRREEDRWTYRAWPACRVKAAQTYAPRDCFFATSDYGGTAFGSAGAPASMACAAAEGARFEDAFGQDGATAAARKRAGAPVGFAARRNLRETAFFLPHLASDANGLVSLSFTMPESLTGWRLMAFAHDKNLRGGYLEAEAVTAKELMAEPNPPRFVREGDEVAFAVEISNRSPKAQRGRARLSFLDAATLQSADAQLGNTAPDQEFALEPGGSKSLEWRLRVADGAGFLIYKALAVSDDFIDGEEGWLPVLSRRVAVQESLPLPVRGPQARTFSFASLAASKGSETIRHQSVTVQMVSQPAWYAVLALPYLMEYPHACCEQTFNRYYANALARHIAGSDPKIRAVFERWKGTDALKSPLEKNPEMKAVMIEETPWLREALNESAARRNVGLLFDEARLKEEGALALRKLAEARISDGSWPWFPGGNRNDVITLYIVAGFGRLRQLGVPAEMDLALEALPRLDAWAAEAHKKILREGGQEKNPLAPELAFYLYARSFFLKDAAIGQAHRESVDFFVGQAKRLWQRSGRQSQAHLALALKRWGDTASPVAIVKSLREQATVDAERGMLWRGAEGAWRWESAPIETQALMIEALLEVAGDTAAAEACKVWLLRQKQSQAWRSSKATADAVYALLLQGAQVLGSDARVDVTLGGKPVAVGAEEAGTGYYEKRFGPSEVVPEMGNVVVTKRDEGVAWGAIHWQYLDDIANVNAREGAPLSVRKRLFVKERAAQGPVLRPAAGALPQGAELVTRLELRADRDLEFIHLKDSRASCAEPVNVLSGYRWQDGLGYYESTRDTASHFFFDRLPQGVYVFEYSCRLQQRGVCRSGLAELQCLYAPEFNSHSESLSLTVE